MFHRNVWQCSEYSLGSKYTTVLDMLVVLNLSRFWIYVSQKNKKSLLCHNEYTFPEMEKSSVRFWMYLSWDKKKFRFLKYKEFYRVVVFRSVRKVFFWENIRNISAVFVSWNIRKFLILELESSIFPKIQEVFSRQIFFIFQASAEKCTT